MCVLQTPLPASCHPPPGVPQQTPHHVAQGIRDSRCLCWVHVCVNSCTQAIKLDILLLICLMSVGFLVWREGPRWGQELPAPGQEQEKDGWEARVAASGAPTRPERRRQPDPHARTGRGANSTYPHARHTRCPEERNFNITRERSPVCLLREYTFPALLRYS